MFDCLFDSQVRKLNFRAVKLDVSFQLRLNKQNEILLLGKSPSGTPEKGMPNNPRCRRLQASTALCWNSTSSTQNKEGKLEIEKDNIDKIISDPNSPLEKRYLNFKKIILKKDLCNSNETKTKYFPSNFPVF